MRCAAANSTKYLNNKNQSEVEKCEKFAQQVCSRTKVVQYDALLAIEQGEDRDWQCQRLFMKVVCLDSHSISPLYVDMSSEYFSIQ